MPECARGPCAGSGAGSRNRPPARIQGRGPGCAAPAGQLLESGTTGKTVFLKVKFTTAAAEA